MLHLNTVVCAPYESSGTHCALKSDFIWDKLPLSSRAKAAHSLDFLPSGKMSGLRLFYWVEGKYFFNYPTLIIYKKVKVAHL